MSTQRKFLDDVGLAHLIALIKGGDEQVSSDLEKKIEEAIAAAGPGLTADEVTVTLSGGAVISVKDGGVTTSKLADGSVTRAKLSFDPTEGITPGAIGAAAASHTHSAADVTSGTLPVARGGTGVTTDDALFQKVVSSHYPDNDELLAYLGLS